MPIISNVVFSAYCACRICCGPDASGITSLGTIPKEGRTIAGPRSIQLQSSVSIKIIDKRGAITISKRTIEDRTAKKWDGKRWDIYFRDHEAAKRFGIQRGTVTILTTTPKGKKKR